MAETARGLTYLNLRGCFQLSDTALLSLVSAAMLGPALQSVFLDKTKITDSALRRLGACCPLLSVVSMYNCPRITDNGLVALVSACELVTLDISGCANITDRSVKALAERSRTVLNQLQMSRCYKISSKGLEYLALCCTRLALLHIDQCGVDDLGLYRLANGCTALRDLSLRKCVRITDQGLLAIASSLHQLERLNIKQCNSVTDRFLEALVPESVLPCLAELNVLGYQRMSDKAIASLKRARRGMQVIRT